MGTDIPAHQMHLADFVETVKDIDDRVFRSIGKPPCEIMLLDEFPESGMPGWHLAEIATLTEMTPVRYSSSVLVFPVKHECYIIWATDVSNKINHLFGGEGISFESNEIKELWFMLAVALARIRALSRGDWFKDVCLRTRRSASRHRGLFSNDHNDIGVLRKLLFEFDSAEKNPLLNNDVSVSLDIYWTLRLVSRALENGKSIDESLRFVIHD